MYRGNYGRGWPGFDCTFNYLSIRVSILIPSSAPVRNTFVFNFFSSVSEESETRGRGHHPLKHSKRRSSHQTVNNVENTSTCTSIPLLPQLKVDTLTTRSDTLKLWDSQPEDQLVAQACIFYCYLRKLRSYFLAREVPALIPQLQAET